MGFLLAIKGMLNSNIPLTAPPRVTGVSVTKTMDSGSTTLRVTWTAPQSDLSISRYEVQYRRSGTSSWSNTNHIGSPPPTSATLTVLDAATEYIVRVRAVSVIGAGEWSVEQTTVSSFDSECV